MTVNRRKRRVLSTTHMILISFLLVILLGSALLTLPISSATGEAVPYVDALFTATSATCVTGLVTLPTVSTWSFFGQVVILLLIQVGGLGIITVMAGLMQLFKRRMGLGDRLLLQDAFNLNTLSGLAAFVKKVIVGTLLVEAVGALCYMTVFVPDFGARGIWISVFNAVSAFCNAGMDVLAENSLCDYATNPVVGATTCSLIIAGGIGYVVWFDLLDNGRQTFRRPRLRFLSRLTLHSKLALTATALLILVGALGVMIFEYNNPATLGELGFFDKLQVALFQSITTRTAGFATVPQENLTDSSALICMLLMFVGGSPVGTAGGVKTVTVAVLFAAALATVRNRNEVTLFHRRISGDVILKSVAVVGTSFAIVSISTLLLAAVTDRPLLDVVYETVSATATVGLSRNLTGYLNLWGKVILIFTMYFGRIGPISLAVAFSIKREYQNSVKNPTEAISVG